MHVLWHPPKLLWLLGHSNVMGLRKAPFFLVRSPFGDLLSHRSAKDFVCWSLSLGRVLSLNPDHLERHSSIPACELRFNCNLRNLNFHLHEDHLKRSEEDSMSNFQMISQIDWGCYPILGKIWVLDALWTICMAMQVNRLDAHMIIITYGRGLLFHMNPWRLLC